MNGEFPWEDEVLDDSGAAESVSDPPAGPAPASQGDPQPETAPDAAPDAAQEDGGATESGPAGSGAVFDFEPTAPVAAPALSRAAAEAAGDAGPGAAQPPARGAGQPVATRRGDSQRQLVRKEYYAISEVSDLVGLPAHVLRYWESQFAVLNPSKNRSGNRVYQRKEIKLILLVKQLLHDEKYTVEGAKQKLEQLRRGGGLGDATARALDQQMIEVLREELASLEELLKADAT